MAQNHILLQGRTILLPGALGEARDLELLHGGVGGRVRRRDALQHLAGQRPPRLLVELLDRGVQLRSGNDWVSRAA
jgi:hypothetical protein